MTNDKTSKKLTKNKGVATNLKDFDDMAKSDDNSTIHSPSNVSVRNVREELKNVIEKMGPNTPPKYQETDTEEEVSTITDSIIQIHEVINDAQGGFFDTSQDESQMTIYDASEISECPCPKKSSDAVIQAHCIESCPYSIAYKSALTGHQAEHQTLPQTPNSYPSVVTLTTRQGLVYSYANSQMSNRQDFILTENYQHNRSIGTHILPKPIPMKQFSFERASRLATWLGSKIRKDPPPCRDCNKNCDLYKINIEHQPAKDKDKDNSPDNSPPRRLVFDLLEELPTAETKTIGTNTKKMETCILKPQSEGIHDHNIHTNPKFNKNSERVDVYYFDHGNSEYYRTTDVPPVIMTEFLVERTEFYTKRFWAQIFGTIHIGVSFVISFLLQLFRFLLQAILRPLTVGVLQLFSDYFVKPFLATAFNGIIQPPLTFLYNLAISVRDLCEPVADSVGYFIREISVMVKALRFVNVETNKSSKNCKPITDCT